jgi:hypothetical protein
MQIDVLSQNTLKLTLSRLDMFDLDIKYESLSGKNPDTKRLLSHVLRTVKLDKSASVDFSGERLFVEAFPRPDGGCMLYISSLLENTDTELKIKPSVKLTSKILPKTPTFKKQQLLCRFTSLPALEGVCKSLAWQKTRKKIELTSVLYGNPGNVYEYRLFIDGGDKSTAAIVREYGELLKGERELDFTREHYKLLAADNAIELMT